MSRASRRAAAAVSLLVACTGSGFGNTALAQSPAIDEIVVTATRRAAAADDVAQSLTVVDGGVAPSMPLATDALADAVGVFVQQTTPGQGAAIIRGQRGSSVLHLVDGMRLNNALFRSAPTQYLALVPTSAIERIEVLRGTAASLYGTDAVGGVVHVVTQRPGFDGPSRQLRGTLALGADSAALARTVRASVDAGNGELAATVSAEYTRTGDRRTGDGERIGPTGYTSRGGRLAVAGRPEAGPEWFVDFQYMEQPDTPRIDELVPGFGQSAPASSEFAFSPNRRTFVHGQLADERGWLGLDWRVDVAWQRIDDDRVTRAFEATERLRENNASDLYGLSASAGRGAGTRAWLVGIEHYDDRISSARSGTDLATGGTRALEPRFPDGSRLRQSSAWTNGSWQPAPRHRLSGGIRLTSTEVALPATAAGVAADVSVTDWGADVGWIFDIGDRWQLAANAGRGFRAPNVADLGTLGERPGNRFNVPNAALGSERVRQADVGVRFRGDTAQFDATVYALRIDDGITSLPTGETTAGGREIVASDNAARAEVIGVEAGGRMTLAPGLHGHVVVNATRGEQRHPGAASEPGDRIPPLTARIGLVHDRDALTLEAWLNAAGEQDRLSERDTNDPRIDPDGTAGWATLDLVARWHDVHRWAVTVGIDNVLDAGYRVHGSGIDAPGRNVYVTLRRRY